MLVESKWGMEMVMGYGQADLVNFENPLVWITVKHIGMLDFIFCSEKPCFTSHFSSQSCIYSTNAL